MCAVNGKGEVSIKLSANRDTQQNENAFRVDFFLFILSDISHSNNSPSRNYTFCENVIDVCAKIFSN